ncbi:MAG: hypothetical protein GTO13_10605 [Proteobacteria bacterium]|nr:hypothetical protein [Pseudomonadota bacterium]
MKCKRGLFSMVFTLAMALFISGFSLPCFSQPPAEGRSRGPGSPVAWDDESPQAIEKRKKVRERIELIRMWKLTEELDLSQETGAKLFPLLRKYDEKWINLQKERRDLMQELRKALEGEEISDKELEGTMERVETNAGAISDLLRQQRQELKGILSPRQQAKFILFQSQFHREIREIIAEARQRRVKERRDDRLKRD